jgi:hypothetical protein
MGEAVVLVKELLEEISDAGARFVTTENDVNRIGGKLEEEEEEEEQRWFHPAFLPQSAGATAAAGSSGDGTHTVMALIVTAACTYKMATTML